MEINIEKIMEEIRSEINARGEKEDMLSFDEIPYETFSVNTYDTFSMKSFEENINLSNQRFLVNAYRPLSGNSVSIFIKKIIRKLTKFYIEPIVEEQNNFNVSILRAVNSVFSYVKEQRSNDETIKELKDNLKLMEIKLNFIQKELDKLKK